ncbi:hypothetical protein BC835DRAFT_428915 [Cytidiella melzeri]|nr:hypothetical protein BC835DRAFT_428915 [Cytidiella melzeri]
MSGQSADINYQLGGKFVWLVPEYTTDLNAAATSFQISIQSIADLAFDDLAKGAGGDYRYLEPTYDPKVRSKVTEVQLLRSDAPVKTAPSGWQGITKDINAGRQRSYLYVVWKSS